MRRILPVVLPLAVLVLAACGEPALTAIALAPDSVKIQPEKNKTFTATGTYDDDTTADISDLVTWASSNTDVVTVDANGKATGVAVGTAEITASLDDVTSPGASVEVTCETDVMVDVSGVAAIHPVTQAVDPTATLTGAKLNLENPALALAGRPAVLKHGDCTDATTTLTPDAPPVTAPFAFTNVDTSGIALGLITVIDDADPTGTVFNDTATGVHGGELTSNLTGARAFAVTEATEAHLAGLDGKNAGDLNAAGWVLGLFLDANGLPIDGATLVDGSGNAVAGVKYPTVDFSGLETDGNSSPNGSFFITGLGLGEYNGQKAGLTFGASQAASSQGAVFIMIRIGQ